MNEQPHLTRYLCTPESWHHVTKPLEEYLVKSGCRVRQMKEKFGGLRVYYEFPNPETPGYVFDQVVGAVSLAETIIEEMYE